MERSFPPETSKNFILKTKPPPTDQSTLGMYVHVYLYIRSYDYISLFYYTVQLYGFDDVFENKSIHDANPGKQLYIQ